jgi:hypothetical protein
VVAGIGVTELGGRVIGVTRHQHRRFPPFSHQRTFRDTGLADGCGDDTSPMSRWIAIASDTHWRDNPPTKTFASLPKKLALRCDDSERDSDAKDTEENTDGQLFSE